MSEPEEFPPRQQFGLAAAVYAVRDDGHILLLKRGEGSALAGQFFLPGGLVEHDELPIDGARRELHEESGLTIGDLHPVGSYPMHIYGGLFLQLTYWGLVDADAVVLSHEHDAHQWVDPHDMLAFMTDDVIASIADGKAHVAALLGHIRNDLVTYLRVRPNGA